MAALSNGGNNTPDSVLCRNKTALSAQFFWETHAPEGGLVVQCALGYYIHWQFIRNQYVQ